MTRRDSARWLPGRSCRPHPLGRDGAVSPVIAEILMVVIAVVLAAGGYLWFSSISDDGPRDVERVGFDVQRVGTGETSDVTWAKVTLVHDSREERAFSDMFITWQSADGAVLYKDSGDGILCTAAQAQAPQSGDIFCATNLDAISDASDTHWERGETYFLPCQDSGRHALTISVQQQTVLDTRFLCDRAAS